MCVCVSVCVCACLCVCVCVEGAVVMGGKNLFLDADAPPCGGPWPSFPAAPKVEYNDNAAVWSCVILHGTMYKNLAMKVTKIHNEYDQDQIKRRQL